MNTGLIEVFIDKIARARPSGFFNPWGDQDPLDITPMEISRRRARLRQHLDIDPICILVGEAPGYQGCHFSGIPFTSERLLFESKIPRISFNLTMRISLKEKPFSEPAATIVWGLLNDLKIADRVVLWNAVPFHPHKPGVLLSNRSPSRTEVDSMLGYMNDFADLFPGVPMVPVGRVAERTLSRADRVKCVLGAVRHPSMGGANKFREQFTETIKGLL